MDFDLFVIGGGSAGVRCARIAAGHGARTGVAESRFWGGTCVNIGCVPKKFLVMAAEYGALAQDARGFGWDTPKGKHDWSALLAAKDTEITRLNGIYKRLLDQAGATIFEAKASFIDSHTLDVGGRRITAEKIVIATGGHPTSLPIPGAELAIVSDDAFYLPAMPKRVAILGSGYIAVEFAGVFAGLGAQTHLIYRQPLPLRGFDADIRSGLAEELAQNGVTLHPGTTPHSIRAVNGAKHITLSDGSALEVDLVFFATGRAPNVSGLNLAAAGVKTTPSGAIHIDENLTTSTPNIYAIGDVTDRLNLTPVATAEGHALADTLFGNNPRSISLENVPTAVFSIPPVATVGLTEEQAAARGETKIFLTRFTPMRHALSRRPRKTIMKLLADAATDKIIGAHMLGEDAPEIMQGIAIAITAGATKADFDRTIGIHPTAAEEFVTLRSQTRVVGAKTPPK
ncbi:glutathione-disulfide reductase [Acidocella aquatica]|uniref:Glutathione-disulfide reductase n=1 Tax=Acidocella aquatica TaxID=1922313 RepID=A0ABQ6A9G0_9PROT|nr:glutathione-disulfide reductase [Acidocella aquatica]GLR66858.1 glutathione-disulfide reductase [Acidocella aquatica]